MEVEDDIGVSVLARDGVCPQLFHEEDLIRELGRRTCGFGAHESVVLKCRKTSTPLNARILKYAVGSTF